MISPTNLVGIVICASQHYGIIQRWSSFHATQCAWKWIRRSAVCRFSKGSQSLRNLSPFWLISSFCLSILFLLWPFSPLSSYRLFFIDDSCLFARHPGIECGWVFSKWKVLSMLKNHIVLKSKFGCESPRTGQSKGNGRLQAQLVKTINIVGFPVACKQGDWEWMCLIVLIKRSFLGLYLICIHQLICLVANKWYKFMISFFHSKSDSCTN